MASFNRLSRRQILRGALTGSMVTVALPVLDCALNANGNAFAGGQPIPTRFLSYFWGMGCTPGRWEPKEPGALVAQALGPELAALEPFKDKINIFTNMKVNLDGRPNVAHQSGWWGQLMGVVPRSGEGLTAPTIDAVVADEIGKTTRFRMLVVSIAGGAKTTVSYLPGGTQIPGETSAADLYARIFGPEFRDPNDPNFKPDPRVMARRSVLSGITEQRQNLVRSLGASDRARLEEYFTSLRQLEQQVAIQLERPAPMEACRTPEAFDGSKDGNEISIMLGNNKLMSQLLAFALACDQTRVVSVGSTIIGIRADGDSMSYHIHTHQDPIDPATGYQVECSKFSAKIQEALATIIQTFANFTEGDSTLLDRSLIMATTESGNAMQHTVDNIPIITAGRAGGAVKTGLHIRGVGDAATRVGLTAMQALKMPVGKFGTDANETSRPWTEVLV